MLSRSRRIAALAAVLGVACVLGYAAYIILVKSAVRRQLAQVAHDTGLSVQYQDVSIGIPGSVQFRGLTLRSTACVLQLAQADAGFALTEMRRMSELTASGISINCADEGGRNQYLSAPEGFLRASEIDDGPRGLSLSRGQIELGGAELTLGGGAVHLRDNALTTFQADAGQWLARVPPLEWRRENGHALLLSSGLQLSVEQHENEADGSQGPVADWRLQFEHAFLQTADAQLGPTSGHATGALTQGPRGDWELVGTVKSTGENAGVVLTLISASELPSWVTEKFYGQPFELQAAVQLGPSGFEFNPIELTRGVITASGWMRGGELGPDGKLLIEYGPTAVGLTVSSGASSLVLAPSPNWTQ